MPLTVCPTCSTPMSEVSRRGVYIDVCPACRGVWLDGGELEKLLATADAGRPQAVEQRRYATRDAYRDDHEDEYDGDRRRRGRRREGGMLDILGDLFD